MGYFKTGSFSAARYVCGLSIESSKIISRIVTRLLLHKVQPKSAKRGISLVELIIVITIVGIISTPIINQIIFSIRQNANAKKMLDGTIIAQKYTEMIQAEGDDVVDSITVPSAPDKAAKIAALETTDGLEFTQGRYNIAIKKVVNEGVNTGSYSIKGFDDFYELNLSEKNKLTIRRHLKKPGDDYSDYTLLTDVQLQGFNLIGDNTRASLDLTDGDANDDISLVFNDLPGNKVSISIYKTDAHLTADKYTTVKNAFALTAGNTAVKYGEIKDDKNIANYVRLIRTYDASNPCAIANVDVYNNRTGTEADKMANLFYYKNDPLKINIKYDQRNVILHDITSTGYMERGSLSVVKKKEYSYKVSVWDEYDKPVVSRDITYID